MISRRQDLGEVRYWLFFPPLQSLGIKKDNFWDEMLKYNYTKIALYKAHHYSTHAVKKTKLSRSYKLKDRFREEVLCPEAALTPP